MWKNTLEQSDVPRVNQFLPGRHSPGTVQAEAWISCRPRMFFPCIHIPYRLDSTGLGAGQVIDTSPLDKVHSHSLLHLKMTEGWKTLWTQTQKNKQTEADSDTAVKVCQSFLADI